MPGKRNIAFLLAIFLLFGTFFSLYYFYYIPAQRNSLHQYGFSLLDRIQMNIISRNRDLRQLYSNTLQQSAAASIDSLDARLKKLSAPAFVMTGARVFTCGKEPTGATATEDTTAQFAWNNGWHLVYPMSTDKDTRVNLAMPVAALLEPAFAYRKEFFESFVLVRACEAASIVVYGADTFGMREDMNGDSLLLRQKGGGFPQTTDVTLRGMPYKLFTWSFLLERQPVVLCGVVKGSTYYAAIHTIPLKVVYPVIIALLLVLLCLPFVKLYFVSRKELLRTRDFALAAAAVAIGTAMITLIIIHVLLLLRSGKETATNLRSLSQQIDSAVSRELQLAGRQLTFFDSQLHQQKDSPRRIGEGSGRPTDSLPVQSPGAAPYLIPWAGKGQPKDNAYYYFNRMSWLDSTGTQRWKVQIDDPATIKFIDVSNRRYYRAFAVAPQQQGEQALMVMEPVNSWTSGDFEINISQRSLVNDARVVVMSTHLYSLQNTILPPGYGYCLMDGEGNVYTHSDMRKALKENFFDETGHLRAIKEAVTSHQDTVLNHILLYSKPHSIYIRPLQQPPLYLVTFYNESYFLAVHMRILAFALLFLSCNALLVLLCMAILYWKPNRHPLFAPADYSPWMLPRLSLLPYYQAGSLLMGLYLGGILCWMNEYDGYLLFFITCLTPANIFSTLAALRGYFDEQSPGIPAIPRSRVVTLVLLQGVLTILCGYWGHLSWQHGWLFYTFQGGLFMLLLAIIYQYLLPQPEIHLARLPAWQWLLSLPLWKRLRMDYLAWHALFIFMVTLCIASLPASMFTWFAQNHEIRQSVKKEQLYLATQLAQRKPGIEHFLRYHDAAVTPAHYIDTIAYTKGIYTIYQDTITRPGAVDSAQHARHQHKLSLLNIRSEGLYLETVNSIIPSYNDPLFYPALRNGSFDQRWHWDTCCSKKVEFTWQPAREGLFARDRVGPDTAQASSLLVLSVLPTRYVMARSRWVVLVIIGLLLAFGIASLIHTTIYRFFSLRFVHWQEMRPEEAKSGASVILPGGFLEKCYANSSYREKIEMKGAACLRDYFVPAGPHQAEPVTLQEVETYEALVIQQAACCRIFFDAVWAACSEEDKWLLMSLAQYGVINYKNIDGIHRLIKNDLVIVQDGRLHLLSPGFRYYILTRADETAEVDIRKKYLSGGRWQQVRMPLLVMFLLIGIFLFITQEEAFKKVGAILTSVTGVVSILVKFMSEAGGKK